MARISRTPLVRHLRGEPSAHVLRYRRGELVRSGRGLAFWFRPAVTGVAEVPTDDRDAAFLFHARTADFQDLAVQGVLTYRALDPVLVAERVDFTLDVVTGEWRRTPLEQVAELLTQLAQQPTVDLLAAMDLHRAVRDGIEAVRTAIATSLATDPRLAEIGLGVIAVRVTAVRPTSEVEQALATPAREAVQQEADEATFGRRAQAVEKERAIAENELANRIELARRQEELIAREGGNARREAQESAASAAIVAQGRAERDRLTAVTQAAGIRELGEAEAAAEDARLTIYRDLPLPVLMGLAARELAGKLERIDHLSLSPETIAPLLSTFLQAGTRRLEEGS